MDEECSILRTAMKEAVVNKYEVDDKKIEGRIRKGERRRRKEACSTTSKLSGVMCGEEREVQGRSEKSALFCSRWSTYMLTVLGPFWKVNCGRNPRKR